MSDFKKGWARNVRPDGRGKVNGTDATKIPFDSDGFSIVSLVSGKLTFQRVGPASEKYHTPRAGEMIFYQEGSWNGSPRVERWTTQYLMKKALSEKQGLEADVEFASSTT